MNREQGAVRFFDPRRGWGFIRPDEGRDCFVHFTAIQQLQGFRTLLVGERVEFEVEETQRGRVAKRVVKLVPETANCTRRTAGSSAGDGTRVWHRSI